MGPTATIRRELQAAGLVTGTDDQGQVFAIGTPEQWEALFQPPPVPAGPCRCGECAKPRQLPRLTPPQAKVYQAVRRLWEANGVPPSIRQLCEETGFESTSTVHGHLKALEEKGYIEYSEGGTRRMKRPT